MDEQSVTRRAFWKQLGRAAGGGALVSLGAYLGLREGSGDGPRIYQACRKCTALSSCSYPQARQTRTVLARKPGTRFTRRKKDCPYTDA